MSISSILAAGFRSQEIRLSSAITELPCILQNKVLQRLSLQEAICLTTECFYVEVGVKHVRERVCFCGIPLLSG